MFDKIRRRLKQPLPTKEYIEEYSGNCYVLANFSALNIPTGNIVYYICKLYKEYGFHHLGWDYIAGMNRFVITYGNGIVPQVILDYFADRCPAMIEEEILKAPKVEFETLTYKDGFQTYREKRA